MDDDLVRIVAEDLLWLRDVWDDSMKEESLRRGSTTLRGLVAHSRMYRARAELGLKSVAMTIEAPYLDPCLRGENTRKIRYLVGGGGNHGGVYMHMFGVNIGSEAFEVKGDLDAKDIIGYEFRLQDYFDSASIYVGGYTVSREQVVKYVANKLGAAHYDEDRKDKQVYKILDENRDRLMVGGEGVPDLDLVYFELLSIGQLVGKSEAADHLIKGAREAGVI